MSADEKNTYIAKLIVNGVVRQVLEFEDVDERKAWLMANEGVDPLSGAWVEVSRKAEPQGRLDIDR